MLYGQQHSAESEPSAMQGTTALAIGAPCSPRKNLQSELITLPPSVAAPCEAGPYRSKANVKLAGSGNHSHNFFVKKNTQE